MTAAVQSGTAVVQAKKQLRRTVQTRLKQLSPAQVLADSQAVIDFLLASPYYTSSSSLSVYLSTPTGEVQTDSLIRHALGDGKRIYVPYCPVEDKTVMRMLRLRDQSHFETLRENRWGIREIDPAEADSLEDADHPSSPGLDLILVPGLAFDRFRRRLGHGRGYYDRYVSACLDYPARFGKAAPRTVALALGAQMVQDGEEIPMNEWDRLPDVLLTPEGEIR
ncbi:5-formyltetrahydrofolate cyclo-ligase [Rhodotorula paludigena]|uniref:5-formyltetrahydrofolate cyclo-ligase n=1 Tax=Rhodotorula paludigena TaxID=86838 RepID=UPI00316F8BD7